MFLVWVFSFISTLTFFGADHNHTRQLFARMPTIVRDICKQNKDHEITKQLLKCMEPFTSAQEMIQRLGLARLVSNTASQAECEAVLKRTLYWYVGNVTTTGLKIQRGEAQHLSPKTVDRLAHELCESVFRSKQPSKYPYNAIEERNNWSLSAKLFPVYHIINKDGDDAFTCLFTSLIKRFWNHGSAGEGANIGSDCRSLATLIYILGHPDTERMFTGLSDCIPRKQYKKNVKNQVRRIVHNSEVPSLYEFTRQEKLVLQRWKTCAKNWTKDLMKTTAKEAVKNGGAVVEIPDFLQEDRFFERFFDIQGICVRSQDHEKRLKDHLQLLQVDDHELCAQICDVRDTQGAVVHTIYAYITNLTTEISTVSPLGYVATLPNKTFLVQGINKYASKYVFNYTDVPFPSFITAVTHGDDEWDLKEERFAKLSLVFGCADGNVVFLKHSEFFRKIKDPAKMHTEIFKIAEGPIECIAPGNAKGTWLFGCKDSVIVWCDRTNSVLKPCIGYVSNYYWKDEQEKKQRSYVIPGAGVNQGKIEALRSYGCIIAYKLSDGSYGTIIPYTHDEYSDFLVHGTQREQYEFRNKLHKTYTRYSGGSFYG